MVRVALISITIMPMRLPGSRLDTEHYKQTRGMCGPACLRIVMAYFGTQVSENTIARLCRSSPVSGTTGINLVKGAKRFGFQAEVVDQSNFKTIEKWLRRGVPVIVDWMSTIALRSSRTPMACGHYSVVCGMDDKHIVLQDPAVGRRRRVSRRNFLNVWFDFKRVLPRKAEDLIIRRLIVVTPGEKSRNVIPQGSQSKNLIARPRVRRRASLNGEANPPPVSRLSSARLRSAAHGRKSPARSGR
jgi:predicted double-glycine peptidase